MAPVALPPSTPVNDTYRHRVLIVDDNRDAADSLAMLLRHNGHTVRVAYDGLEAIVNAGTFLPELLLLDIGLPNLSGYEVASHLRSKAWGTNIHIVALTGWGQPEDRVRTKEAGFDQHWVKPVDIRLLMQLLHGPLLRRHVDL